MWARGLSLEELEGLFTVALKGEQAARRAASARVLRVECDQREVRFKRRLKVLIMRLGDHGEPVEGDRLTARAELRERVA